MNNLINNVLCLSCRGKLQKNRFQVRCSECGRKYEVKNEVLYMLARASLKEKQSTFQKQYYDIEYEKDYVNQDFEWRRRYVNRLAKFLPKKKPGCILDLACGQGYMTLAVAKMGYRVIACDIAISGLYRVSKEARRLGINNNILFIWCDVNKIAFVRNAFDFVVMLHVLEHLTNDALIVKRVINFSKPTARYFIGVPLSLRYVFPLLVPLYLYSDFKVGHKRRYTIEVIRRLFGENAKLIHTIYTGHLIKFLGLILAKLGMTRWERTIEDLDEKLIHKKEWASNITTIIEIKNENQK